MNTDEVLLRSRNDTIRELLEALDSHSAGEGGHADRVAVLATAIGDQMGLDDLELLNLRYAAALHDVGKITVDRSLLSKLGDLSEAEFEQLRAHAREAESVLHSIGWLKPCLPSIKHHHERWDGEGYPSGLKGGEIPLAARIIAVAETFDHLTMQSGWRQPMKEREAIEEIRRSAGTQFDPKVVAAFLEVQPIIQPVRLEGIFPN